MKRGFWPITDAIFWLQAAPPHERHFDQMLNPKALEEKKQQKRGGFEGAKGRFNAGNKAGGGGGGGGGGKK